MRDDISYRHAVLKHGDAFARFNFLQVAGKMMG